MPIAEGALGPRVDAALFRISCRQIAYRDALWDEEKSAARIHSEIELGTSRGRGGEPAQAYDRHHVEEHEIAQGELARKRDWVIAGGRWLMAHGWPIADS